MNNLVLEFHEAFDLPIAEDEGHVLYLWRDLITEESEEVDAAIAEYSVSPTPVNKAALLKELADLQYVVNGMAVGLGLDLDEAFRRVHVSNMSKLVNGKPVFNEAGKVLKGPNYAPPNLSDLV